MNEPRCGVCGRIIMSMKTGTALIAALVIAGCSGGAERPADENTSTASVQTRDTTGTPDSAGMAGMDHGNMAGMNHGGMAGTQSDSQTASGAGMAGMDHSRMPGMSGSGVQAGASAMDHSNMPGMKAGGASAGMAEMDHSRMGGMAGHAAPSEARGESPTMDHSRMAGMQAMDHSRMQAAPSDRSRSSASAAGSMAEMDHGNMNMSGQARTAPRMDHAGMPGMQPGAPADMSNDAGMEKLRALVAELVQDPMVQAQIQADTALRRRWADEGVRRVLLNRQ